MKLIKNNLPLLIGDISLIAILTIIGFATHNTLTEAFGRLLITFFALLAGWLLIAPHLQVYDPAIFTDFKQLWRPFLAMVMTAPFGAWLRGLALSNAISPIFVLVLVAFGGLGILLWRALYIFLYKRK